MLYDVLTGDVVRSGRTNCESRVDDCRSGPLFAQLYRVRSRRRHWPGLYHSMQEVSARPKIRPFNWHMAFIAARCSAGTLVSAFITGIGTRAYAGISSGASASCIAAIWSWGAAGMRGLMSGGDSTTGALTSACSMRAATERRPWRAGLSS